MNIAVTADGYIHVGRNEWASLEQIQRAVIEKTNPGLTANCPEGTPHRQQQTKRKPYQIENVDEEPLELPSMLPRMKDERKVTSNAYADDVLPLPSMVRRTQERPRVNQNHAEDDNTLPLPSMVRR